MKTRLARSKNSRQSSNLKKILLLGIMACFIHFIAFSQTPDKKAAEIKKQEAALKMAKANHAKAEKAVNIADSLVSTGTTMISESKAELKTLAAEKKQLDKEYATKKKPLTKQVGSKDKDEATQAKNDMKALDTQYKADIKANDTKMKAATKKMTTGEANVAKGKGAKKTADASLKTAQASLDAAQEKYDAATGAAPAEEEKGGKKKKK